MYIIMPFIMALQYNSKWLAWPTLEGHFTATHTTATDASATATDASATNVTGIDATAPLMPLLTTIGGLWLLQEAGGTTVHNTTKVKHLTAIMSHFCIIS